MMKLKFTLIIIVACFMQSLQAQRATSVFSFLEFSPTAKLTSLAQYGTALYDVDPGLSFANPALLHPETELTAGVQHGFLKPSVQLGRAYVADRWDKHDIQWMGAMTYSSHGDIIRADEFGNQTGTFEAKSLSIYAGVSKSVYERLQVGAALEYAQSNLAEFSSMGMVAHLGALYHLDDKQFTVGLSWKNIGWQWTPYAETSEHIRSDLQVAISKRLAHLPFRFSFTYHDLNRWNLLYESPVDEENILILGAEEEENTFGIILNNFARHLAVNGEFFIGKNENIRLRLGYDHQRRQELSISTWNSLAGFSFGAGVNIKGVVLDYGYASYHLAGGMHHLGLSFQWHKLLGPDIL